MKTKRRKAPKGVVKKISEGNYGAITLFVKVFKIIFVKKAGEIFPMFNIIIFLDY